MNLLLSTSNTLCLSLLTCLASAAYLQATSKRQDPIVGAWVFNQQTGDSSLFGVGVFNADGTFSTDDSGNLTQSLPSLASAGLLITNATGTWKKKSKNTYELLSTNVLLFRGIDCQTFAPVNLASPACPVARLKVVSDFVLEKGCLKATSNRVTTFHAIDDLTLTLPMPAPLGPVPPQPSTRVWQKLST